MGYFYIWYNKFKQNLGLLQILQQSLACLSFTLGCFADLGWFFIFAFKVCSWRVWGKCLRKEFWISFQFSLRSRRLQSGLRFVLGLKSSSSLCICRLVTLRRKRVFRSLLRQASGLRRFSWTFFFSSSQSICPLDFVINKSYHLGVGQHSASKATRPGGLEFLLETYFPLDLYQGHGRGESHVSSTGFPSYLYLEDWLVQMMNCKV